MRIEWQSIKQLAEGSLDLVIGFTVSNASPDATPSTTPSAVAKATPNALGCASPLGWIHAFAPSASASLAGLDDARGVKDEWLVLYPEAWSVRRVALAGLGTLEQAQQRQSTDPQGMSASDLQPRPGGLLDRVRAAAGEAMIKARDQRLGRVALALDAMIELAGQSGHDPLHVIHEAVYGALHGLYRYTAMKTARDLAPDMRELVLVMKEEIPGVRERVALAEAEAEAVRLACDLINAPANHMTPSDMVTAARAVAADHALHCTVLDREQMENLGMGALLAVARGSANEPALVCLEYAPAGHEQDKPIILIGKGLTFDSGGISLKPAADMHRMKRDMAGAATVLAAMSMLKKSGGTQRVIGLMACAENMPDALAMRPGDVVTTLKGTTIEILNTDAEGRLVLCDALSYAQQQWGEPAAIVDVATLTGACVVALGWDVAGIFGTDDVLVERIERLGAARGDWFWRMPLWDCYADTLKSQTADFANSGAREGGAASAAAFLRHFVNPAVRWAHLDIAGPSYVSTKTQGKPAGATGFAVRTLAALAR